jgi:tRNA (guanine37-N1)-methyltransferase
VRLDIITIFPDIASGPLAASIIGKAQQRGLIDLHVHNLRDWARDKHRTTDDTPYGGSQGMVMKCEPFFAAVEELKANFKSQTSDFVLKSTGADSRSDLKSEIENLRSHVVLLSPGGRTFTQQIAEECARLNHLILLCGHYEGVDQRVIDHLVDEEISIGDYVLTNGAVAAAVVADAVIRLVPGVLGDENSAPDDSFSSGRLEFPQYTRPVEFRGWRVPDVLLSGHHAEIARWRREQSLAKTRRVRPDLLKPSDDAP